MVRRVAGADRGVVIAEGVKFTSGQIVIDWRGRVSSLYCALPETDPDVSVAWVDG